MEFSNTSNYGVIASLGRLVSLSLSLPGKKEKVYKKKLSVSLCLDIYAGCDCRLFQKESIMVNLLQRSNFKPLQIPTKLPLEPRYIAPFLDTFLLDLSYTMLFIYFFVDFLEMIFDAFTHFLFPVVVVFDSSGQAKTDGYADISKSRRCHQKESRSEGQNIWPRGDSEGRGS